MTTENNLAKPLSRRTISRSLKARPALRDNLARVSESVIVVGGVEAPEVKTEAIPVERVIDGRKSIHYEIRIEVDGVRLGKHAPRRQYEGRRSRGRIPQSQLGDYDELMIAFVPDHLAVDPRPRQLLKAVKRIPERLDNDTRYNTSIFTPDERRVVQDTSYPRSAFGRCKTSGDQRDEWPKRWR